MGVRAWERRRERGNKIQLSAEEGWGIDSLISAPLPLPCLACGLVIFLLGRSGPICRLDGGGAGNGLRLTSCPIHGLAYGLVSLYVAQPSP